MSVQVFSSRNLPLGMGDVETQAPLFDGIGVGLIAEWARKVLAGTPVQTSRPRERPSRDLAVRARKFQLDRWRAGHTSADLLDAWEGALLSVGLRASALGLGSMNGPQLLQRLVAEIPAGGIRAASIALPAQKSARVVYQGVALMRQLPGIQPGPLLLFDPGFGLFQCDSAADFAATTEYFAAFTQPAWAYAITGVESWN